MTKKTQIIIVTKNNKTTVWSAPRLNWEVVFTVCATCAAVLGLLFGNSILYS